MQRKRWVKNKGFSLVELIIAIAILVILTGLLAPQFMRYMEKSRAAVCIKNRDEMLNIYKMEYVSDITYSVDKVIKDYKDKEPCPSKGTYLDGTRILMGIPWIFCSEHDEELLEQEEDIILSEFIYSQMIQFTKIPKEKISEDIKMDITQIRNDTLREYLWKKNGGTWPQFSTAYTNKYAELKGMYVQPYLNMKAGNNDTSKLNEKDVIVFATTNNDVKKGNWNTSYIYNPNDCTWYSGKSITITDRSWDEVWKTMQDNKWKPLN